MHRYINSIIDVFPKYLHLLPVKTMSGSSIASAFRPIFHVDESRRPVWVRTDKDKVFLHKHIQVMLRHEVIQFNVCKNPDVKCAAVERTHWTNRDRLHKYFTYKNTFRYIDMPHFVKAYNDTVHLTTGMALYE